jgi:release factor glutamine methyltransferase
MKTDAVNVHCGLWDATQALALVSETAFLDAQTLLAHLTGHPRAWLLAHPEAELGAQTQEKLGSFLERLSRGEPLPYVVGEWEFFGLPFCVNPEVLIPRPETELLVETAIGWLQAHPRRRHAADVGAGSGCIAVSLAVNVSDLRVIAGDISQAALSISAQNALRHRVGERIEFMYGDLLQPAQGPFDLICANLPYIPTQTLRELPVAVWEPALALDGGLDGFALIRRLLAQAKDKLAPGGLLLAEIEASQGDLARLAGFEAFPQAEILVQQDLAGRDRLLVIQKEGEID